MAVTIVNFRTADLCAEAVRSALGAIDPERDRVVVVDNDSRDGSFERIAAIGAAEGWGDRVLVRAAPRNGGFSYGHNFAFASIRAEAYLMLNSDARLEPGALESLVSALDATPEAGIVGPAIVDGAGTPQASVFRYRTPLSEFLEAADLDCLRRALARHDPLRPVPTGPEEVEWLSFACALVRAEVIEALGPLDDAYFLYFEDTDYCRRAREAGWSVLHWPSARAVHTEGTSSGVPEARARGQRPALYFYASRGRYFAKFYGRSGLWAANCLRMLGRPIGWLRAAVGRGRPTAAEGEWRDLWRGAARPLSFRAEPDPPAAGRSRAEAPAR